jgi:hypothetical protein
MYKSFLSVRNTSTGMLFFLMAFVISFGAPANALAQSDAPGTLELTLYQGGMSLVHDARQLDLTRGAQTLRLSGFPSSLQMPTVLVRLDGSVGAMAMETSGTGFAATVRQLVGEQITLEHHSGATISGELTEFKPNLVVVRQSDGSYVMLTGLDGFRVVASAMPAAGPEGPVLRVDMEARRAGLQALGLHYLAHGLRWEAEYALVVDSDERTAVLNGWSVLHNGTDLAFEDAVVRLVAGEVNPGRGAARMRGDVVMSAAPMAEAMAFDGGTEPEAFFEYQRFTLPGRVSLGAGESLRLGLMPARESVVRKRLRYASSDRRMELPEGGMVQVFFEMNNDRNSGPGMAIPSGTVRMYKDDNGVLQLIGQDQVRNTPLGGIIRFNTGMAFDILVRETITAQNRVSDRIFDQTNRIEITNQRRETTTVEIERQLGPQQRITSSSVPYTELSSNRVIFELTANQGATETLEFTLRNERL